MTSALRKISPAGPDPQRQQQQASNPDRSVWVNASAGSGKTTVLTRRVTRLLLEGVKPERILCITFTRAAAAEMAMRVAETLSAWATCSDGELGKSIGLLQNQPASPQQMTEARRLFARTLSCPGGMRIRTIHAFGQEVLRRFPIEAGLPPHFTVIEETDARALQEDVLMELLRELSSSPLPSWEGSEEFGLDKPSGIEKTSPSLSPLSLTLPTRGREMAEALNLLVQELGEKGFREAMNCVFHARAKLTEAAEKSGGVQNLIAHIRAALHVTPEDSSERILHAAVDFTILPKIDIAGCARQLLGGSPSFAARGQKLTAWLDFTPEERTARFADYCRCFLTADGEHFKSYANKDLLDRYPDLDKILHREADRLQTVCSALETLRIAEVTTAILRLGFELSRRYDARKRAQAALDYDDLIIHTSRLLRKPGIAPWILYKLDGGIDHILVDEAQDTSRAQWDIVKALSDEFFAGKGATENNRTLFAVGDEKQSIFSFQNADPDAFAEMQAYFAQRMDEAGKELLPVGLHVSFRSAPAVLKAIDAIFARETARAGVSMQPVEHFPAPLQKDDPPKIGRVEVWPLLPMPEKEKSGDGVWQLPIDYEDEHDPQAELAARIADKIASWQKRQERLPGLERPIAPGDIMILLRKRGRFADLMVRALKQRDVPVTGVDRMHLIEQLPVMDLLAVMQSALLPEDDLNLATVLRGPLLNLSEDQLMELALGREGSLWRSLADKASANAAFATAHQYLSRWLGAADFMSPFAMLVHILNESCPGSIISGRRAIWSRLGPDALDPIDELLNAAQNFSRRHAPSLQSFLHWLTAGDSEIKRELDSGEGPGGGQVRIMTVHAAKGLEAPVVFLPDAANMPRAQDVPELLWDGDIPLYIARKPGEGLAQRLWHDAQRKQLEEYRRLLYVALSRAANRLYICGWEIKKDSSQDPSWYNLVKDALQPLHEPAAAENIQPPPLIAFADPDLRKLRKQESSGKRTAAEISLPDWAFAQAPVEKTSPRSIAPSQIAPPPAATPDSAFARGRIIHRLLESLPDMNPARQEDAAARFLANPQHRLTEAQQAEIKKEVIALLRHPDYAPLFGPGSRAEVPLAGHIDGQAISGQVDRLCLQDDAVWIVDYKTNRPPPARIEDVPEAYRAQLASYRGVLRAIYPGKTIRCFLLWTYGPRLMELPEESSKQ